MMRKLTMKMIVMIGLCFGLAGCHEPPAPPRTVSPPVVTLTHLDRPQSRLIEDARASVMAEPQSAEAWGHFGQSLHAVEFNEAAATCYEQATLLDPNKPQWPYLLGLLQLQEKEQEGLANLARVIVMVDVRPDAPRLQLAHALVERGRLKEARPHLSRLLEISPQHAGARLEWARLSFLEHSLTIASESLKPCLTNQYTARTALLLLAQIRQRQGQTGEAAQLVQRANAMPRPFNWPDPYLREVLRLRVDRQKLQDRINGLLMRRQFSKAATELNRLLGAYPNDPEGILLLGRMRFQEGKCAEAEQALLRHLSLKPQSVNGLIQLSLALLCQQRWADAVTTLQQALVIKPDFAEAHYNLGYAHSRAGDSSAAMIGFSNALRCNPGYVDAHTALARELFKIGSAAQAEDHLARALRLKPKDIKALRLKQEHP